jgi:hypothetical protein
MKAIIITLALSIFTLPELPDQENCQISGKEKKLVTGTFGKNAEAGSLPPVEPGTGLRGNLHPGDCIHIITRERDTAGFLLSTRAKGRFDYFDYSVLYSVSLQVEEVLVTVYRSTHGAAICRKSWLDQFTGYRGEELVLGKEIDAVSGGTLSAESLVADIRRCHDLMTRLRAQGTI